MLWLLLSRSCEHSVRGGQRLGHTRPLPSASLRPEPPPTPRGGQPLPSPPWEVQMAGFWGNERLTSLQAPLVSLDSESSESEAAHKVPVFNPASWGKGHALHVVGGLCVYMVY